ncbi:MAG: helix-turn-helix transcriptional regulator [Peptoniphilus sp.]|nr:helix-turn-helix transcriptional regulator [Peptoniphilus sp.]MDY3118911.1 helix-turn-helix transcriptional regulator [Peptoniphilus sp.]
MTFAEKVKILRMEKGWIQQELADALGVSVRTVKNYESGDSYPKNRLIYKKMARVFGVDINDLLHEEEEFSAPEKDDEAYDDYKILRQGLGGIKKALASQKIDQRDKDILLRKIWDLYWKNKDTSDE